MENKIHIAATKVINIYQGRQKLNNSVLRIQKLITTVLGSIGASQLFLAESSEVT